jgi:hypothetical protein
VGGYLVAAFVTTSWTTASLAERRSDDDNANHRVPFVKLLCVNTSGPPCVSGAAGPTPPLPGSFNVPAATASGDAVKELVVEFVTSNCVGTARTTSVFIDGRPGTQTLQVADTGDNFSANKFPMSVAQFNDILNVNAEQSFAQQTHLTYAPGTTVSISFSITKPGSMQCAVQLNGHFVTR